MSYVRGSVCQTEGGIRQKGDVSCQKQHRGLLLMKSAEQVGRSKEIIARRPESAVTEGERTRRKERGGKKTRRCESFRGEELGPKHISIHDQNIIQTCVNKLYS